MMCAVALRLKIAGHVWKTVKFLDFRIHGESFISRLPLSCDGLLSCSCVLSNPRSLLQSNSRLLCQCVSVFTYDFKKKHWWQYPGCQRLFMRGFRFRLSLKKWSARIFSRGFAVRVIGLRPTKLFVTREKTPLAPRVWWQGFPSVF